MFPVSWVKNAECLEKVGFLHICQGGITWIQKAWRAFFYDSSKQKEKETYVELAEKRFIDGE